MLLAWHSELWGRARSSRPSVRIMCIEHPVATRHHRDMTEKLLKVTLNPNKQQQFTCDKYISHMYMYVYYEKLRIWSRPMSNGPNLIPYQILSVHSHEQAPLWSSLRSGPNFWYSRDNDFSSITVLLKALHCGDLLRVIALLFIIVNSTGVYH